jgi:hypothetical protein
VSTQKRGSIYKMMRLHVFVDREGALTAEWSCNDATTLSVRWPYLLLLVSCKSVACL